jgi:hypothetical protein
MNIPWLAQGVQWLAMDWMNWLLFLTAVAFFFSTLL